MSRSYRKRPFVARNTTKSESENKTRVHRRERHTIGQVLRIDPLLDALPLEKVFGDSRDFGKDGKRYLPKFALMRSRQLHDKWILRKLRK